MARTREQMEAESPYQCPECGSLKVCTTSESETVQEWPSGNVIENLCNRMIGISCDDCDTEEDEEDFERWHKQT